MTQTGIKSYNLGFISSQGPCVAAWGGYPSLSPDATGDQINYLNGQIAHVQANGGKVAASFGGVAVSPMVASGHSSVIAASNFFAEPE